MGVRRGPGAGAPSGGKFSEADCSRLISHETVEMSALGTLTVTGLSEVLKEGY